MWVCAAGATAVGCLLTAPPREDLTGGGPFDTADGSDGSAGADAPDAPNEADAGSDVGPTDAGEDADVSDVGGDIVDSGIDVEEDAFDGSEGGANVLCSSPTTLESLVDCILSHMPLADSEGFVVPSEAERADWRSAIHQMLAGSCGFTLPDSLTPWMELRSFEDNGNGKTYCVLLESYDTEPDGTVDKGWGTVIVDLQATRELVQQASYPISDLDTEREAVEIFKGTDSRLFAMGGTHRNANGATGVCVAGYKEADVAHNVASMIHATTEALYEHYGATPWWEIQWDAMVPGSCPTDVYMTHGTADAPEPTDPIALLRTSVLGHHPAWHVDVPGTVACNLNAKSNVQGRLINGVTEVCTTNALHHTGQFINVQQAPGYRAAADWVDAVLETWP